jgi:hypothetical protein
LAKRSADLLHVALGTTAGWRRVDDALDRRLAGLGVDVIRVGTTFGAGSAVWRYGSPALDLHQAAAVAHATSAALRRSAPTAILYSTFTALLAQPHRRPREAVWFDAPIAIARPGRRNAPLRGLERWQARRCDLLIVQSLAAADAVAAPLPARPLTRLPPPIDPIEGATAELPAEPPFGVIYAGQPYKKGLDIAVRAWQQGAPRDMQLLVTGVDPAEAVAFLSVQGLRPGGNVTLLGAIAPAEHRALTRHAAVYVSASRREEYGNAQLEALRDGAPLATVPSAGAAEPVALARELEPRLVADAVSPDALAPVIHQALALGGEGLQRYRTAAARLLDGYSSEAFARRLGEDVIPALLG